MLSGRLPRRLVHYRSLPGDRIGCGFLGKPGIHRDFVDTAPPNLSVVAVLRGRGEYRDQHGNRERLGPGSVFQRRPGRRHSTLIDPASDWSECFVDLGAQFSTGLMAVGVLREELTVWESPLVPSLEERIGTLVQRVAEADEGDVPRIAAELLALAIDLQTSASGRVSRDEQLLEAACRYLAGDFAGERSLQAFCREHGLGYERFRKRFHHHTGISPHRYRIRRRLDEACRLLAGTDLRVNDVARSLGYSSPFDFSAQFKRHIGVPPSTFAGRA